MTTETLTCTEMLETMRAEGLTFAYLAPHDHGSRHYFAFGDGTDAMLDHSVTATPLGRNDSGEMLYAISRFGRARRAA